MSKNQVNKNRKLGALVAYTTLACTVISVGIYVYRQQQQKRNRATGRSTRDRNNNINNTSSRHDGTGQDDSPRASLDSSARQDDGRSLEAQSSSLSRLGSKIARTVKRNRKVMTISLKNTIVWNPSPDPTAPNYGFVEGAIPLLFHLAENFNLHLILLCPPLPSTSSSSLQQDPQHQQASGNGNGKDRVLSIQEQDEIKRQRQMGQDRDREQILTMLRNAGLILPPGTRGPKLIDPRQLLVCETEEGVSHVVRHLESQVHVEAQQSVLEMVQGVIPKVVFVQKRPGHSRASSTAREQQHQYAGDEIMTRSHVRVRSTSRSSSASGSGNEDHVTVIGGPLGPQTMGDSFVEVVKASSSSSSLPLSSPTAHVPLVSGYVTQAGRKGYVEVTDQLMKSSLNPECSN
ncbi:hypothetical protein EDD11_009090 [Mortierella claussenii]|nr:hypothetical protein EDD11_009090 [Mortierella claussenii]